MYGYQGSGVYASFREHRPSWKYPQNHTRNRSNGTPPVMTNRACTPINQGQFLPTNEESSTVTSPTRSSKFHHRASSPNANSTMMTNHFDHPTQSQYTINVGRLNSRRSEREHDTEWQPKRRSGHSGMQMAMREPTDYADNDGREDDLEGVLDTARMQEAISQDLIDLLRTQISSLLTENEKVLLTLDDYRERLAVAQREQKETARDPSDEHMALQTALGEARLREAELSIAFSELQERVGAIDRTIETDPDLTAFFNAVTISTTTLSRVKPQRDHQSPVKNQTRTATPTHQHQSSPSRRRSSYVVDHRSAQRHQSTTKAPQQTVSPRRSHGTVDRHSITGTRFTGGGLGGSGDDGHLSYHPGELEHASEIGGHRSGLDSPQSDSGCSLTSHTTNSDAIDERSVGVTNGRVEDRKWLRNGHTKVAPSAEAEEFENGFEEDRCFSSGIVERPRGFVSLLRRSRSSATDNQYAVPGFYSEMHSPIDSTTANELIYGRQLDDTPTPTDGEAPRSFQLRSDTETPPSMMGDCGSGNEGGLNRFSKIRASLRHSFGLGPAKPDFRTEALAARQGEARALLGLRETRMELLRVQSRCQTLQRHMERLEAINTSRIEEIEVSVSSERDLRQEIRALQRRIFELEAEHREFKVNQRIKEMELMSKLAETNLRLSHAEMTNQQAAALKELNKVHDAASGLLSAGPSQTTLYLPPSPNGRGLSITPPSTASSTEYSTHVTRRSSNSNDLVRSRPVLDHSMTRLEADKRYSNQEGVKQNVSSNDLSKIKPFGQDLTNYTQGQRTMDQSLGSLSEFQLKPDMMLSSTSRR